VDGYIVNWGNIMCAEENVSIGVINELSSDGIGCGEW
jgi:hypothetical protein